MRPNRLPYALVLLLLATSCQSSKNQDVVCETYIHRYGVPLDEQEWSSRGQHGQILSTMKNGVVVARTYDSGILHGETTYTFPHREVIEKREVYDKGVLKQEAWNYANGAPQRQLVHYSPTQKIAIAWYEQGVPQCREEYENGKLLKGDYFNRSNDIESQVQEGWGIRTRRDGYGQLMSVDEIQNGDMIERATYHANGSPESITPYKNECAEGQRRTFLPNGEPNTIEEWQNNRQHGNTVVFQNGQKFADVAYQNGKRHGIERRYRNEQDLVEEVSWVNGQKQGPCHSYVGSNTKTTWHVQDREVNKATYDAFLRQQ